MIFEPKRLVVALKYITTSRLHRVDPTLHTCWAMCAPGCQGSIFWTVYVSYFTKALLYYFIPDLHTQLISEHCLLPQTLRDNILSDSFHRCCQCHICCRCRCYLAFPLSCYCPVGSLSWTSHFGGSPVIPLYSGFPVLPLLSGWHSTVNFLF